MLAAFLGTQRSLKIGLNWTLSNLPERMSYASEQNQEHQLYSLLAVALFLKLTQSALGINETSVQEYVRLT